MCFDTTFVNNKKEKKGSYTLALIDPSNSMLEDLMSRCTTEGTACHKENGAE